MFPKTILKLLNEYKAILKKHLDRQEWVNKVSELGLKRKILKNDDEVTLYQKAAKVVEEINAHLTRNPNTISSWHSGLDEFCQYLKNILRDYQTENGKIVHISQQASRALVDALQLITTVNSKRSHCTARKLHSCGQIIAKFGTREQQELFGKALKNLQQTDVNFYPPQLHNFEKPGHEFIAHFPQSQLDAEAN